MTLVNVQVRGQVQLHYEQTQGQLNPYYQGTHAEIYEVHDYHYLYDILISKFLNYFEVDLKEETFELVKSTHEVNNDSLSKMGFTKIGGRC